MTIEDIQPAATLIYNYMHPFDKVVPERGIVVPKDSYSLDFQKSLAKLVETVHLIDKNETHEFRGTVTVVSINEQTGEKHSAESEDMLVFAVSM